MKCCGDLPHSFCLKKTYVYNYCNICNITDLLLQHPYETLATYLKNI